MLRVVAEGTHHALRFRCRKGHGYSAWELIVGKEDKLEEHVWAAVTLLDELATLLRELQPLEDHAACAVAYARRVAQAEAQLAVLRAFLDGLDRTALDGDDAASS